ncbi:MAG: methyltransferase domain-containing protein [Burkholderiales bacterium]
MLLCASKDALACALTHMRALSVCLSLCIMPSAVAAEQELDRTGGPFVPTPQVVVDQMLRIANVGAKDFVVDLGSGDGVIVLTAASQLKAAGYGVDIDPALVKYSNAEANRLGIADRASFHVQDVFKADLSRATVITLYLLPSMMVNLRPKIFLESRPGTRVVSHDYNFDEWQPDDQIVLDVPEKEKVNGVPRATISLWIVPARVQGKWQVQVDGGERYDVTLRQKYQSITGSASAPGKDTKLTYASLRGEEISFTMIEGSARRGFTGKVSGDAMQGTVELGAGRTARWSASRS